MTPLPIHYNTDLMLPYGIECADFALAHQAKAVRSGLISAGPNKMQTIKKCFLPVAVVCAFASSALAQSTPTPTPTSTPLAVLDEQYGTAPTGVPLYWKAIPPDPILFPGRRSAVLVVHEGGFRNNDPGNMDVARDLAMAGYLALAIEYRLAPPHLTMNSPRHCCPGQNDVGDDGYYPESKDDMRMAILAARADARCNGKVGAIGGSAGGAILIYWAGTGTAGGDRLDVAISLSPQTDFHDPASLTDTKRPSFAFGVTNYVNSTDSSNGGPLDLASPYRFVTSSMCPYFIIASDNDTTPLEQYPDMIRALDAAGVTNYRGLLVPNSSTHGFEFWPDLKGDMISFLEAGFAAAEPTPTPTETPTPTPSPTATATTTPPPTPTPTATPAPPSITTQPANTTVNAGETARFRVTASGTAPLHYQWRKNGVDIPRATKASYTTPPVVSGDNGSLFSVIVSNRAGSVTSNNAILTVR